MKPLKRAVGLKQPIAWTNFDARYWKLVRTKSGRARAARSEGKTTAVSSGRIAFSSDPSYPPACQPVTGVISIRMTNRSAVYCGLEEARIEQPAASLRESETCHLLRLMPENTSAGLVAASNSTNLDKGEKEESMGFASNRDDHPDFWVMRVPASCNKDCCWR